jgi:hypothetical protein
MSKPQSDPTWKLVILTIIFACLVVSISDRISGTPPNDEPYTGLCVRASAQLSC